MKFNQNTTGPVFAVFACILCSAALAPVFTYMVGCSSLGGNQQELAEDGPYQGDTLLARFDQVMIEVGETFDSIIALADRNPQVVASSESLTEGVNKIRAELDGIPNSNETMTRLAQTRNAYVATRSALAGQALEGELDNTRVALETARALLPLFLSVATETEGDP